VPSAPVPSGPVADQDKQPGEIGVAVGGASDQLPLRGSLTLAGPERTVGPDRVLDTPAEAG
jgi:beta-xylosidase